MVDAIEERLYDYNTEGHRPSFVKVQYGDITFFGQLKTLDTEYTLFDADGIPLRAELKVTLTGYCSRKEEEKHFSKHSPDVSRMVTLNEGRRYPPSATKYMAMSSWWGKSHGLII